MAIGRSVARDVQHVGEEIVDVHAREHRFGVVDAAAQECVMREAGQAIAIIDEVERAEFGFDIAFENAFDGLFGFETITDQVGDAADLQSVRGGEYFQLRTPRHGAVVGEDFDEHAGRFETGELREIARRFGVAGAREHAAGLRGQRENVAGLDQIARFRIGADGGLNRARAVVRGNAGGDAFGRFDRHGEIGVVARTVVADHRRQAQLFAALARQRQADQSPRLARHEVDVFGPHFFGGHDEVAFVLAVFVVDDDDHAAGADFVDDFADRREAHERSLKYMRST